MFGLDVHKAIVENIYNNSNDYEHETFILPGYVNKLIENGKYGIKKGKGLYIDKDNQVFDINTGKYRDIKQYDIPFIDEVIERFKEADYKKGINIIIKDECKEAMICKNFLINYVIYSLKISKEISKNLTDCDVAMAEGFNWIPPYALKDLIGKESCMQLAKKFTNESEETINELLNNEIKSEYKYEKFLKAKR